MTKIAKCRRLFSDSRYTVSVAYLDFASTRHSLKHICHGEIKTITITVIIRNPAFGRSVYQANLLKRSSTMDNLA